MVCPGPHAEHSQTGSHVPLPWPRSLGPAVVPSADEDIHAHRGRMLVPVTQLRCGLGLAQQRDSRARHRRRVEERRPLKPRAPRSNGSVGPDGSPRTQRWPAQLAHGPAPHGHSLTGFPREPVSAGGAAWAGRRSAPPPLPTQELAVTGQGPARPTTQLSVGCFTVPISDHGWPYVTSPPRAHTTNK